MTPREKDFMADLVNEHRTSVQEAAYTIYTEMLPNNRKPMSPRDFHTRFKDNWIAFAHLEDEEVQEE